MKSLPFGPVPRPPIKPLIDRRQRVAAALLLSAFDLPADMVAAAKLWKEAARACPGISADEAIAGSGRRAAIEHARTLIDEMLAEGPPA